MTPSLFKSLVTVAFSMTTMTSSLLFAQASNKVSQNKTPTYQHWLLDIFQAYKYQKSSAEIPEPFVSIQKSSDGKNNEMHLMHDGTAALYKRLEMISRAQRSIEAEYFIFSPTKKKPAPGESRFERSSQMIIQALIQKAAAGVKVRLLVDNSITVFRFTPAYVQAIKNKIATLGGNPNHFEARYYNTSNFQLSQFRSHRKLFIVDDQEAITGGRNIEDKYFNLDYSYNFHDRDIWVKGPLVPVMKKTFEAYWSTPVTGKPDFTANEKFKAQLPEAQSFLVETAALSQLKNKVLTIGQQNYNTSETQVCNQAIFASDKPITSVFNRLCLYDWMCKDGSYKESHRITERVIGEQVHKLKAKDLLLIDTPYVMLNTRSGHLTKFVTETGIEVRFFTNSLASTDATYSAAVFYREMNKLQQSGLRPFIHSAKWNYEAPLADQRAGKSRWGMHSKSHVYGNNGIFVGTYNLDNRSSFYNTENGIFCLGNEKLTEDLRQNILLRHKTASYEVVAPNKAIDPNGHSIDVLAGAPADQINMMKWLTFPTEIFQFLM